jgi:hypothetical protein
MQHLEGSGTPVLYIGRTVLEGLGKSRQKKKEDSFVYWKKFILFVHMTTGETKKKVEV